MEFQQGSIDMKVKKSFMLNVVKSKYAHLLPDFKERKTEAFTAIILTFSALSFFGYFAINPTLSTIVQLRRQLADNKEIDQKLEQKIAHLTSLQRKYSLLQNDIPLIESAIPRTPSVPQFVGKVQSLGQISLVDITRLQALEVELANSKRNPSTKDASSFGFSLDVNGSYSNISRFLDMLVSFDRIVTIDSISIHTLSFVNQDLHVSLKGRAYFKH